MPYPDTLWDVRGSRVHSTAVLSAAKGASEKMGLTEECLWAGVWTMLLGATVGAKGLLSWRWGLGSTRAGEARLWADFGVRMRVFRRWWVPAVGGRGPSLGCRKPKLVGGSRLLRVGPLPIGPRPSGESGLLITGLAALASPAAPVQSTKARGWQ